MSWTSRNRKKWGSAGALWVAIALFGVGACGGDSEPDAEDDGVTGANAAFEPAIIPSPLSLPDAAAGESAFATRASTGRFLTQGAFGPTPDELERYVGKSESAWFLQQLAQTPSLLVPRYDLYEQVVSVDDEDEDQNEEEEEEDEFNVFASESATFSFWRHAVAGPDQLRQRMAWALSQIFVVSNGGGEALTDIAVAVPTFQDLLISNALGNYRDILELVTYSPAMGYYLTFIDNQKADPTTGRVPDENYAREIIQLFSIGVIRLQMNGEPVLDNEGLPIETYTNADITGLARVFTGLGLGITVAEADALEDDTAYLAMWRGPMTARPEEHSTAEKTFLGSTIPANTSAEASIRQALDIIFAHPNVAPFVSRQLIQRFVTSAPVPSYIERVARAFESGSYELPDGSPVGEERRGDLTATVAAVLFDEEARRDPAAVGVDFGKVREPLIRVINWARAFELTGISPEFVDALYDTSSPTALAQHPYRAPSVFNFYRPGYVAPGSFSGSASLTMPELQLVNATSTPNYVNFIVPWVFDEAAPRDGEEIAELADELGFNGDQTLISNAFRPNYDATLALANDTPALIEHLNERLTYGSMEQETKNAIQATLDVLPGDAEDEDSLELRVTTGIILVMSSPDFLVQR
ncbi:MAG: DUF1800 domain-containing protein [Myxococcota bacterium]